MSQDKARAALTRLRQWRVDELRKEIGQQEKARAALVAMREGVDATIEAEQALMRHAALGAGDNGTTAPVLDYGAFADKTIAERSRLDAAIAQAEADIADVQERLRQAFLELKQVEILSERARTRALAEDARREQTEADAISSDQFIRAHRKPKNLP